MSQNLPTPREIERWVPADLSQVVGCTPLKAHFYEGLRLDACGVNTFVEGQSGSGKTAAIKAFVRSLMCPDLDRSTFQTCKICDACRTFDVRYADQGLFTLSQPRVHGGREPLHFYPVNCGAVSEAGLQEIIADRSQFSGKFLIYLDEAHRLVRRKMEHLLLKPLEELDALWIASTAQPDELDTMFHRRFSCHLSTTLPTDTELNKFLAERCLAWGILTDDPNTLKLLAKRSGCLPAKAVSVLAIAAGRADRRLDRDLVLKHCT